MCKIAEENISKEVIYADICKDEVPVAEYYICSGALNNLTKFETNQFIQNCYKSSRKAFIFNVLFGNKESKTYNYMKLSEIEKIAADLDVKEVKFIKNYLDNDITIGFYR